MKEPKFFRRYDYDRALLPNQFVGQLDSVSSLDEARTSSGASIGYPGWGLLYYLVLSSIDPTQDAFVLETGTNFGASTIMLAQALEDSGAVGQVHTVEIDEETYLRAAEHLGQSGVGHRVTQHLGDAKVVLPAVLESVPDLQIAFLDGCHLIDDVVAEFASVVPKLTKTGLVIFDNTYLIAEANEDQRVHGALGQIVERFGGNVINLPSVSWYTPGMAVWQAQPFTTWPPRPRVE